MAHRHLVLADVLENRRRVALQRIAVAARSGQFGP